MKMIWWWILMLDDTSSDIWANGNGINGSDKKSVSDFWCRGDTIGWWWMWIVWWTMITNGDLCNEGSSAPHTAALSIWCAIFERWLAIMNFTLAAIQCNMMVEIRCGARHIRIVDATIVLKSFIFIIGRCRPLMMAIQVHCPCWALRVVVLMAPTVN